MCFINKVVFATVLSLGGFSRLNMIYGVLPLSLNGDYFWSPTFPATDDIGTSKADGSIACARWSCCGGSGGTQASSNPFLGCLPSPKHGWVGGFHGVCVWHLAASAPSTQHDPTGLWAAVCNGLLHGTARTCPDSIHGRWLHWLPAEFPCSLSCCVIIKE